MFGWQLCQPCKSAKRVSSSLSTQSGIRDAIRRQHKRHHCRRSELAALQSASVLRASESGAWQEVHNDGVKPNLVACISGPSISNNGIQKTRRNTLPDAERP